MASAEDIAEKYAGKPEMPAEGAASPAGGDAMAAREQLKGIIDQLPDEQVMQLAQQAMGAGAPAEEGAEMSPEAAPAPEAAGESWQDEKGFQFTQNGDNITVTAPDGRTKDIGPDHPQYSAVMATKGA